MIALIVAAAVAREDGSPYCNVDQHTIPMPGATEASASVVCNGFRCTVTADKPFKGIVISVSTGTITVPSGLQPLRDGQCVTHAHKGFSQSSVTVDVSSEATVRATVVYRRSDGVHRYSVASTVAGPTKSALVIGAGPGGLAAARTLSALGIFVTVYERGPATTVDFDGPIQGTYHTNAVEHTQKIKGVLLGSGIGGTQSINGAVYAPGSATDLAASVGVSVADAALAQEAASRMVPHELNPPMMWACRNSTIGCDRASAAVTNTLMSRRSIAYELPSTITVVGSCRVESVTDSLVSVTKEADGCVNVTRTPQMIVIVAAGALVSPELLGAVEYTGWNHYFTTKVVAPPSQQTFEYRDGFEINTMKIGEAGLEVRMEMVPSIRETHFRNQNYTQPAETQGAQAWHFAGTVRHAMLRVESRNVYIGDASALLAPFNCHTSMPAAAAGVLAARASVGLLEPLHPSVVYLTGAAPALFVAGSWVVLAGVAIHLVPEYKWHHYWVMPVGVLLIASAIVSVHVDGYRLNRNSTHGVVGYVVSALLAEQVVTGSILRPGPRPRWLRILHRTSGISALVGIVGLHLNAAVWDDTALSYYTPHTSSYSAGAIAYAILTTAVVARAVGWFRHSPALRSDPLL